jgi:oligopeptide transport system substrate-binding protein
MSRSLLILLCGLCSVAAQAVQLSRGTAAEPNTLDPHRATGNSAAPILYDMNVGLTTFDVRGRVIPGAAESWTVTDDGLEYTFTLRPGLKWSDGSPISSTDFIYSARRLVTPATAARFASFFYAVENARAIVKGDKDPTELGIAAPDERTVVYRLEYPAAYFLQNLAANVAAPVPRSLIEEFGRKWTRAGRMLSNGAYRLVEFVPQSHVLLEKNPHFYAADSVAIDRVRYYPTQNLSTQLNRYVAGELDILLAFPPDKVEWIKENLPGQLLIWPALGTSYFLMNFERPPFDDLRVRKALSISIDREGLAAKILTPGEAPAYAVTPPAVSGYQVPRPAYADQPMAERLAEARRLMAEAGYTPANPLELVIRYDTREETRRLVVALASMWRPLGVKASPFNSDFITLNKAARTGDFAVLRYAWFAPNDDPITFLGLLESTNPNNYSAYRNPEFDARLRAANFMLDPAERLAALSEAEAEALEDFPVIPVYYFTRRFLVAPHVKGFQPNPRGLTLSRYYRLER